MIDFKKLVQSGVHFGHQVSSWCPKMAPYIWGKKNGVHLIDVSKTAFQMERAAKFLESVVASGKSVLWVGTKKPAQGAVTEAAMALHMPYVNHRWIGGTLSNNIQVKKSVTKLLHYKDIVSKTGSFPNYTKKELNTFNKMVERLEKNVGGIKGLTWPVGAVILVDIRKEASALREAVRMGIPVVALVDTNCDPSLVDFVIPANDDAPRSIKTVIEFLQESVARGQKLAQEKKAAQEAAAHKEREEVKAARAAALKEASAKSATVVAEKPVDKTVSSIKAKEEPAVEAADKAGVPPAKKAPAKKGGSAVKSAGVSMASTQDGVGEVVDKGNEE